MMLAAGPALVSGGPGPTRGGRRHLRILDAWIWQLADPTLAQ